MRRINFSAPVSDSKWDDWRQRCLDATDSLITDFNNGIKPQFTDLYKELKHDYYINDENPFWSKCSYCERNIRNQFGDIEHYRPEGKVTDEKNNEITRLVDQKKEKHPGYYWLAYEFTNLMPSCARCNRPTNLPSGKKEKQIGKWCKFPVNDYRAWEVNEEVNEEPLLINPLVDDPSEHLTFDPSTGIIGWKTKKGEMTVSVFGLNEYDLPDRRVERYELVKALFAGFVEAISKDRSSAHAKKQKQILAKIKKGFGEFSAFAMCAINDAAEDYIQAINIIGALPVN